jgi:hypothetical protein
VPFLAMLSQSLAQMVLLLCPLSAQAQPSPLSVTDKLDASDQGVAEALASSSQQEVVIGTQYQYWNQVPSRPPPGGGDAYSATVGDVLTFRYGSDDNVILMATEPDGSSPDWESCTNFPQGTQVGRQTLDNAASDYYDVGLRNVYQAVVLQPGMLYFSCQRGGEATCQHCSHGQKIKVSVSLGRPPASPPPPPLPCNLVEDCDCSCCDAAVCPGWPASQRVYVRFSFNAESAESCNAAGCSSRFARCAG